MPWRILLISRPRCFLVGTESSPLLPAKPTSVLNSAITALVAMVVLYNVITRSRSKKRYPPGPKGFPIIGNVAMPQTDLGPHFARMRDRYGMSVDYSVYYFHTTALPRFPGSHSTQETSFTWTSSGSELSCSTRTRWPASCLTSGRPPSRVVLG